MYYELTNWSKNKDVLSTSRSHPENASVERSFWNMQVMHIFLDRLEMLPMQFRFRAWNNNRVISTERWLTAMFYSALLN